MDAYWALPPVSRTLTALAFTTSVLVYGGLLDGRHVVFYTPWIFKFPVPEIWRFVTSFWLTGPKLSIIFEPYFLWTYASALETSSVRFRHSADFFVYVIFIGVYILITSGWMLGGMVFISPLILGLAYTYAQDNKSKKVSFFVVTMNAIWLPWALLVLTLVLDGPSALKLQFPGLLAAHSYDFLTRLYPTFGGGRNVIRTPKFVQRWFNAEVRGVNQRGYGTAYRPGTQQSTGVTSTGTTGSSLFSGWGSRGPGRRLGGD